MCMVLVHSVCVCLCVYMRERDVCKDCVRMCEILCKGDI